MRTPLGPKYIPYSYMEPLGKSTSLHLSHAQSGDAHGTCRDLCLTSTEAGFSVVVNCMFRVWGLGFRVQLP